MRQAGLWPFWTVVCGAIIGTAGDRTSAATADPNAFSWTEEYAGQVLDLTNFRLVFHDEFDRPSVTAANGQGPWFAPVHSKFGVAIFDEPRMDNRTYTVAEGVLTIRATKDASGKWHGGNAQTVNLSGKGFAQRYGYFEARMKFPAMPGAWLGFWLKSQLEHTDRTIVRPELDIVEWYGGNPRGHHRAAHLWPPSAEHIAPGGLANHWHKSNYSAHDGLADGFHVYGALIGQDLIKIYLDGKEVARFPTLEEYRLALYPLVSLTLYEKDVEKALSPFELQVDYVRVYASNAYPTP